MAPSGYEYTSNDPFAIVSIVRNMTGMGIKKLMRLFSIDIALKVTPLVLNNCYRWQIASSFPQSIGESLASVPTSPNSSLTAEIVIPAGDTAPLCSLP